MSIPFVKVSIEQEYPTFLESQFFLGGGIMFLPLCWLCRELVTTVSILNRISSYFQIYLDFFKVAHKRDLSKCLINVSLLLLTQVFNKPIPVLGIVLNTSLTVTQQLFSSWPKWPYKL